MAKETASQPEPKSGPEEKAPKPERKLMLTVTLAAYDDQSIDCQTNPPVAKYMLIGMLSVALAKLKS